MRLLRQNLTAEFNQEAVALLRGSVQRANEVVKELGVSQIALSRWLREAMSAVSSPNGFRAAEELKVFWREVEQLWTERGIPKTAAAFFASGSR